MTGKHEEVKKSYAFLIFIPLLEGIAALDINIESFQQISVVAAGIETKLKKNKQRNYYNLI